jgi:hypothetical protein
MSTLETRETPVPPPGTEYYRPAAPRWTITAVIVALLLGLAGIGLAVYAITKQPAKVAGPAGPQGAQGPRGPQGIQGKPGAPGAVAASTVVRGSSQSTSQDPPAGTVLDAKTSCPAGKTLLSGGAQVSAPGVTADRNVTLRSSFPVNNMTWETVALVTGPLGPGVTMTMTPYVVCGTSTSTSASGTPTTAAP